jgi:hypothetical protein
MHESGGFEQTSLATDISETLKGHFTDEYVTHVSPTAKNGKCASKDKQPPLKYHSCYIF